MVNQLFSASSYKLYVKLLLGLAAACFLGFFAWFLTGHYFPSEEDETIYYSVTKLFAEANSLSSASFYDDNVARLLDANWYGIFYNIFYGSLAKVTGTNGFLFVGVNVLSLLLAVVLVYKMNMDREQRWNVLLFLLLFNVVFCYSFTYYPELLNVLLGMILTFFLIRMYEHRGKAGFNTRLCLYVCLCLAFSFVRATWIFWIVAILPYAKSKADLVAKALLVLVGITIAFLYTKYLCAAAYVGLGRTLTQHTTGNVLVQFVADSFSHVAANVSHLLFSLKAFGMRAPLLWNISKYITPIAIVYFGYRAYMTKNLLLLSSLAVSVFLYGVMLLLYTPEYPFFMKITTSVFILNFVVAVYLDEVKLKWFYLLILALCFPLTLYTAYHHIEARRNSYADFSGKYKKEMEQLQQIATLVDSGQKMNTVLILPGEFTSFIPTAILFSALPYSTPGHTGIRYSWLYENPSLPYEKNFPLNPRFKTDYVLSRKAIEHRSDLKLLQTNNLFYFYRITPDQP